MRNYLPLGVALVGLTVAGCSGPRAPFDIGTQAAPIALVLGERAAVQQAPVGPVSAPQAPGLAPFVPGVEVAAPEVTLPVVVPTVPPVGPCPDFDPLAPVSAGGTTLPGPPQAGTYTYRAKTTDEVGPSKGSFTGNSVWKVTVSPPDATTGGYDVTTEVTIGKSTTTRVLRVLTKPIGADATEATGQEPLLGDPQSTDPNAQVVDVVNIGLTAAGLPPLERNAPNLGRYGPAGVYLVEQSSSAGTFRPSVPIPLVQTPIGDNSFTGVGSDGTTTMVFTSTVKKRGLVNACGTKLESTQVALTGGQVVSAGAGLKTQVVSFTETFDFGLQFGGLPLRDAGEVTGSSPLGAGLVDNVKRTFDFTINMAPKPAKAP